MSEHRNVDGRACLVAALTASAAMSLFELVHVRVTEPLPPALSYWAATAGVAAAGALVPALLCAALGLGVRWTLGLWVALSGALVWAPLPGLAAGLLTGLWLWAAGRTTRIEAAAVGIAFAAATLQSRQLASRLALDGAAGHLALFTLLGLALALAVRLLRPRLGRGAARLVLVLAVVVLLGLAQRRPAPDPLRSRPEGPAPSTPSILVVVLDTVRADHLGLYGYERDTTPHLARWVERRGATVYDLAFSNGTWTVPSHASLLSGRLPSEHGAQFGSARRRGFRVDSTFFLAEALRERGYGTLAVFANGWLSRVEGIDRGFHHFEHSRRPPELELTGEVLRRRLVPGWLVRDALSKARGTDVDADFFEALETFGDRPVFALLNYCDAHGPYAPLEGFRGRFAPWSVREPAPHLSIDQPQAERDRLEARYDEEILALDAALDELMAGLESRGRLDSTWIWITSDHGEAFAEHGVTEHGTTVYNEVTRVPLIVFPPGGERLHGRESAVSLLDVTATAAAIAGAPSPPRGRDLRAPVSETPQRIEFYGDPEKAARHGELARSPAQAVVSGAHKLVVHGEAMELYDLRADPGERSPLAPEALDAAAWQRLTEALIDLGEGSGGDVEWTDVLSDDAVQELRGLGYLGED